MITNLLPAEATHTTLYLFEKEPLLIVFDRGFTQIVGPSYSPDGSMLEFQVLGDRNNFINGQKLLLEIKRKISRNNDGNIRTGTDAATTDAPYLCNNALHSLFSECTLFVNVVKISNKNGNYAHKALLKRNFCQENGKKHMASLSGILLR